MKTIRIFTLLFVLIILSGTAFTQTITLNVPIQLNEIHPDVRTVFVNGFAYKDQNKKIRCADGRYEMSMPPDGNIHTTVSVVLEPFEGYRITDAVMYTVSLQFVLIGGTNTGPSQDNMIFEARAKEGTTFINSVSGEIHW
ncbi:hypothetical protein JW906_08630 [bacterium]|nr:hypothetical protein [bacterium]